MVSKEGLGDDNLILAKIKVIKNKDSQAIIAL